MRSGYDGDWGYIGHTAGNAETPMPEQTQASARAIDSKATYWIEGACRSELFVILIVEIVEVIVIIVIVVIIVEVVFVIEIIVVEVFIL